MTIKVKVFMNEHSYQAGKPVMERIIDYDDSLLFDAMSLTKTLRVLYGAKSVVTFDFI